MYTHHIAKEGTFPIKLTFEISSDDKLEKEAKARYDAYFNNEAVTEDNSDILRIPHHRFEEFQARYQELLEEFQ